MSASECLLVCGEDASIRIKQSVLPHLDFKLEMVTVRFKEDFLEELSTRQPKLAVVDWRIAVRSALQAATGVDASTVPAELVLTMAGGVGASVPAHELLGEAFARSRHTRVVVACHNKISNEVKANAAAYENIPSVIKRMGFINSLPNMRYLAKLFTRTYAGRTWKPTF